MGIFVLNIQVGYDFVRLLQITNCSRSLNYCLTLQFYVALIPRYWQFLGINIKHFFIICLPVVKNVLRFGGSHFCNMAVNDSM
jgi:hypothetical protein